MKEFANFNTTDIIIALELEQRPYINFLCMVVWTIAHWNYQELEYSDLTALYSISRSRNWVGQGLCLSSNNINVWT